MDKSCDASDEFDSILGLWMEEGMYESRAKEEEDVCSSDDLPEIEIVSLLSEQIPTYRLRADTITDFTGYDNEDWVRYPAYQPKDKEHDLSLTDEQIENTFSYFTLCGVRVSQMTKTYNDIDAVTRLLEEKERDLEIAARIGQSLLEKNRELQIKNEALEEDVVSTADKVSQLRHELGMKDALLHIYTNDDGLTPDSPDLCHGIGLHNLGGLQRRLTLLEEENTLLRTESTQLQLATDDLEEKETKLVDDCVQRLSMANDQVKTLSEDNMKKTETYYRQQEEITNLLAQVVTCEAKIKKITAENAELQAHLQAAQMSQKSLTTEIADLKTKYEECIGLLHESNEEIKALRNKHRPRAVRQYSYTPFAPRDSLASELESSLHGDSPRNQQRRESTSRVLETARLARKQARKPRNLPGSNVTGLSGHSSDCDTAESSHRSSIFVSDTDAESLPDESIGGHASPFGKVGLPGSNDLETALRRLTARQEQDGYARRYRDSDRGTSDTEVGSVYSAGGDSTPTPCWTPDSYMSTGSGMSGGGGFRFPEKLQIVKPLEGSATLHQWQRLARPDLTAVLDDRPGVAIKGGRQLDVDGDMDSYTLSDYEEDDDFTQLAPRRYAENTSLTYTLTTATVLHPTDDYNCTTTLTSSAQATRPAMIAMTTSTQVTMSTQSVTMATCAFPPPPRVPATPDAKTPLAASTPVGPQHRGTSTFSVSLGLAHTLRERGFLGENLEKFETNRISSIVTETMYDNSRKSNACTPSIYSAPSTFGTASTTSTGLYSGGLLSAVIPSFSINAPDDWMKSMDKLEPPKDDLPAPKDEAFALNLIDKIKDIGLSNILEPSESRKMRPQKLDLSNIAPTETPPNSPTKVAPKTPPSSPQTTPAFSETSPTTPPNSPTASSASLSSPFTFKFSRPMSQVTGLAMAAGPQLGLLGKMSSSTVTRAQRHLRDLNIQDS